MAKNNYIIGIDEVGRGPLAGPVAVGVAVAPVDFDWDMLAGVTDSKKLTEARREVLYLKALALRKAGVIDFAVKQVSAAVIDRVGIVQAIERAMAQALERVVRTSAVDWDTAVVKLDGGLRAPNYCVQQETIIKGDSKEKTIGLASVVAKVTRDRYMQQQAKKTEFAPYNFAQHKGYGTTAHRALIQAHGLSTMHRASYCKNIEVLYYKK